MTDSAHRDVEALHTKIYDALMRQDDGHSGPFIALTKLVDALDALLARLEQVERERDDYRMWNERVRTCSEHTQDVAAPVGDCLICKLEQVEAERDKAWADVTDAAVRADRAEARVQELEAALREIVRRDATSDYSNIYAVSTEYAGVARRALAPDTAPPCESCDGHGAMAGAHTEGITPCPTCGGSGRKKVDATA